MQVEKLMEEHSEKLCVEEFWQILAEQQRRTDQELSEEEGVYQKSSQENYSSEIKEMMKTGQK